VIFFDKLASYFVGKYRKSYRHALLNQHRLNTLAIWRSLSWGVGAQVGR